MKPTSFPFSSFSLNEHVVSSLATLGYVHATPVQQAVIPAALRGESLIARYETGSGKTHAFLIPTMANMVATKGLQTILLTPTRELANQTYQFAKKWADVAFPWMKIARLTGGTSLKNDLHDLSNMPHMLILTPGRLSVVLDSMSNTKFHTIRTVVMDEADMLMDASFIQEVDILLSRLSAPQLLVFSASLSKPLLGVLRQYIRPDHVFEPTEKTVNNTQISHYLVDTRHQPLPESIAGFMAAVQPYRLMIFASRVATVLTVHEALTAQGMTVGLLHGDMAFRDRKAMLKRIQLGEYAVILASDIAARGMDIADVSDVLSLDLPKDLAYYFHRAGRTGRYDQLGKSYVFYQKDDQHLIDTLQQKGVHFTRMTLKADGLKTSKDAGRPFQHDEQPELKRDIKKAIQKYRTTQVKPGYKKKVKRAIERVKKKHRRAAIDKVIRKRVYGGK